MCITGLGSCGVEAVGGGARLGCEASGWLAWAFERVMI